MNFNTFKRKLLYLIERIKMSESDYLTMKAQSQMYTGMISTIKYSINDEREDVTDGDGNLITQVLRARTLKMNVNVIELLAEGGITFDKNAVELNVIADNIKDETIKSIETINPKPTDTIVLRFGDINADEMQCCFNHVQKKFPNNKIVTLPSTVELEVASKELWEDYIKTIYEVIQTMP